MPADKAKLEELVYYAIDRCTPRRLKLEEGFNTLAKILDRRLDSLELTSQGVRDMWQILDAYTESFAHGKRVPAAEQKKCVTAGDVWRAECKSSGIAEPDLGDAAGAAKAGS